MNKYSLGHGHRAISLPFRKSKGTRNVSRGIRLPKAQNKFKALTKDPFFHCFCYFLSSVTLSEIMRESMQMLISSLTMITVQQLATIDICPTSSNRCHRSLLSNIETMVSS